MFIGKEALNMAEPIIKKAKQWHEAEAIEIIADQVGVTPAQIRKALCKEGISWRDNVRLFFEFAGQTDDGCTLQSLRNFEDFEDFEERLRGSSKQHTRQLAAYAVKAVLEDEYGQHDFFVLTGGPLFADMVEWLKKQNALEKGYSYFPLYGAYLWHSPENVRAHRAEILKQTYSPSPYDWPFIPEKYKDARRMELVRDFNLRYRNEWSALNV